MPADPLAGRLIVDANVLFSALLRDSTTRHLILFAPLDLHTPAALWDDLDRNRAQLIKKSRATPEAFDLLLASLRDRIRSIPDELVSAHLRTALDRLEARDQLDAPYVAAALAVGGSIWTHDRRLRRRAGVPVVSTARIVAALG